MNFLLAFLLQNDTLIINSLISKSVCKSLSYLVEFVARFENLVLPREEIA